MADKDEDAYRVKRGLIETTDPGFERPLWRKPGFEGVVSLDDMDMALSAFLGLMRRKAGLNREQLAELLGISAQVYGRYERAESKLSVTRLIHLSEILGFAPIEMIYASAPHLFGKTARQAENQIRLMRLMSRMRPEAVDSLLMLVSELAGDSDVSSSPS